MTTAQQRVNGGVPCPTTTDQDEASGLTKFAMLIATRNYGWRITRDSGKVWISHSELHNRMPFPDTTEGRTLALAVLSRLNSKS